MIILATPLSTQLATRLSSFDNPGVAFLLNRKAVLPARHILKTLLEGGFSLEMLFACFCRFFGHFQFSLAREFSIFEFPDFTFLREKGTIFGAAARMVIPPPVHSRK